MSGDVAAYAIFALALLGAAWIFMKTDVDENE